MVVGLTELDEKALIRIMKEPKNALVKQYKTLFKMDGVDLDFQSSAIEYVAKRAIALNTGARGLRTIIEESMLDTMYKVPSDKSIKKIIIKSDGEKLIVEPVKAETEPTEKCS